MDSLQLVFYQKVIYLAAAPILVMMSSYGIWKAIFKIQKIQRELGSQIVKMAPKVKGLEMDQNESEDAANSDPMN